MRMPVRKGYIEHVGSELKWYIWVVRVWGAELGWLGRGVSTRQIRKCEAQCDGRCVGDCAVGDDQWFGDAWRGVLCYPAKQKR